MGNPIVNTVNLVVVEVHINYFLFIQLLRPGFARLNLPYFMSQEEVTFVIEVRFFLK